MVLEQGPEGGFPIGTVRGEPATSGLSFSGVIPSDPLRVLDHGARVSEANDWLARHVADPANIARYHAGDTNALSPDLHAEVQRLRELNEEIANANQAPQVKANLESMRLRIVAADRQNEGADSLTRAAARISQFDRVHHIFDFDNTISDYRGVSTHEMFRRKFPASDKAELMLNSCAPDREIFNTLLAAAWQPALRQFPDLFEDAAGLIPIREGVDEYFKYLTESPGAQATILSGSFEPFVRKSMEAIPNAQSVPILAVPIEGPTIASIKKGVVIEGLVAQDPGTAIVYYGDGESDVPSLEAQGQIALFVVLRGSKFHRAVDEAGALHVPFNDFREVRAKMAHIQALAQQHRLDRYSA